MRRQADCALHGVIHDMRLADVSTYVIHSRRLVDRWERLSVALSSQGIRAQWVSDPDATELTRATRRKYYRGNRRLWRKRASATRPIPFRRLTASEIAATISHIEAYSRLIASGKEWALILEDDAVFEEDFSSRFDAYFASIPDDADLVFLGGILRLQLVNADPNQHFFRKDHPATNCVDSYVVGSSAARAILETIVPFALPIDWELNYQLKLHDLRVYWIEPPLVTQGSEVGIHQSSIR